MSESSVEGVRILVLDRGHVYVGRVQRHPELALHFLVSPARCVRRWGTSKGLAQLKGGPLPETVLDDPCVLHLPYRAVLFLVECEGSKWSKALGS